MRIRLGQLRRIIQEAKDEGRPISSEELMGWASPDRYIRYDDNPGLDARTGNFNPASSGVVTGIPGVWLWPAASYIIEAGLKGDLDMSHEPTYVMLIRPRGKMLDTSTYSSLQADFERLKRTSLKKYVLDMAFLGRKPFKDASFDDWFRSTSGGQAERLIELLTTRLRTIDYARPRVLKPTLKLLGYIGIDDSEGIALAPDEDVYQHQAFIFDPSDAEVLNVRLNPGSSTG